MGWGRVVLGFYLRFEHRPELADGVERRREVTIPEADSGALGKCVERMEHAAADGFRLALVRVQRQDLRDRARRVSARADAPEHGERVVARAVVDKDEAESGGVGGEEGGEIRLAQPRRLVVAWNNHHQRRRRHRGRSTP